MIIYSTMPLELIFENNEQVNQQKLQEITFGHATMLIEPINPCEGKIVRLISPDPQDYLNPRFAPGQTITFRPDMS